MRSTVSKVRALLIVLTVLLFGAGLLLLPHYGTKAAGGEKSLGTVEADGAAGMAIEVDNTGKGELAFSVTAGSSAAKDGSVLFVPENGTAFLAGQTVPAGFKGKIFLSFNTVAAAEWSKNHYDVIFDGAVTGSAEVKVSADDTDVFQGVSAVDAAGRVSLLQKTLLGGSLFTQGGAYAEEIAEVMAQESGAIVTASTPAGTTYGSFSMFTMMGMGYEDASGAYGIAIRLKNLSAETLLFDIDTFDLHGVEYATGGYSKLDPSLTYTFIGKDGTVSDLVYKASAAAEDNLMLPAGADGVLVIPFSLLSGYNSVRNVVNDPDVTVDGKPNGRLMGIQDLVIERTRRVERPGFNSGGLFVGDIWSVDKSGSMTRIYDLAAKEKEGKISTETGDFSYTMYEEKVTEDRVISLGTVEADGAAGMAIDVDNTGKMAVAFSVTAGENATLEEGSALFVPEDGIAFFGGLTVPAGFKGKIFLSFNTTAAALWSKNHYDVVFNGAVTGSVQVSVTAKAEDGVFTGVAAADEAARLGFLQKTLLGGTLFTEGAYAQAIAGVMEQEDGAVVTAATPAGSTYASFSMFTMMGLEYADASGAYGIAIRLKNLSEETLLFDVDTIDSHGVEYATGGYSKLDPSLTYTFVDKNGTVSDLVYQASAAGTDNLMLPAGADGVLIIPFSLLSGYNAVRNVVNDPAVTADGKPNGRLMGIQDLVIERTRNQERPGFNSGGLFVGDIWSVNKSGSMTRIYDLVSKEKEGMISTATGDFSYTMSNDEITSISAGGYRTEYRTGNEFTLSGLKVTATYKSGKQVVLGEDKYTVDSSAVNMEEEGNYTVTITLNENPSVQTTFEVHVIEVIMTVRELGSLQATGIVGFSVDVDNTEGEAFSFFLKAGKRSSEFTDGSVLLIPDSGIAYLSAQTIPAGFKGKLFVETASTAPADWSGNYSFVTFDGTVTGEVEVSAESSSAAVNSMGNLQPVNAAGRLSFLQKTLLGDSFGEGGKYAAATAEIFGEDPEGIVISSTQDPGTANSSWGYAATMGIGYNDASAAYGVALRIVNLSSEELLFNLITANMHGVEFLSGGFAKLDPSLTYTFVDRSGKVTEIPYHVSGSATDSFVIPKNADGLLIVPFSLFTGYNSVRNLMNESGIVADGTSTGRVTDIQMMAVQRVKGGIRYGFSTGGMLLGDIYSVNMDGTITSIYSTLAAAGEEKVKGVTDFVYSATTEHAIVLLGGMAEAATASGRVFGEGETVTFEASRGYALRSVKFGGQPLSAQDGVYTYTIAAADVGKILTFEVDGIKTSASVEVVCNDWEAITVSATGDLPIGTKVIVALNDGYEVESVTVNGEELGKTDGVYGYIIREEDAGTTVVIDVKIKARFANAVISVEPFTAAKLSSVGKVEAGTVITVSATANYVITEVKLNGTLLLPVGGAYTYTVTEEDLGHELLFEVSVEKKTETEEKGGCGSVLSLSAGGALAAAVAAVLFIRKRKSN